MMNAMPGTRFATFVLLSLVTVSLASCGGGGGGSDSTTPDVVDEARISGSIPLIYNDCPDSAPVPSLNIDELMVLSRVAETNTVEQKNFSQPEGGLAGYAVGSFSPRDGLSSTPDSLTEAFLTGTVYTSTTTENSLGAFVPGYTCTETISWNFFADGTTVVASSNHVNRNSFITCNKANSDPLYCTVTYDGVFTNEDA